MEVTPLPRTDAPLERRETWGELHRDAAAVEDPEEDHQAEDHDDGEDEPAGFGIRFFQEVIAAAGTEDSLGIDVLFTVGTLDEIGGFDAVVVAFLGVGGVPPEFVVFDVVVIVSGHTAPADNPGRG